MISLRADDDGLSMGPRTQTEDLPVFMVVRAVKSQRRLPCPQRFVPVAQRLVHWSLKPKMVGSIPLRDADEFEGRLSLVTVNLAHTQALLAANPAQQLAFEYFI